MSLSGFIQIKLQLRIFLFTLSIIFLAINHADCEEKVYYSIHVASFKKLKNANNYVNSMSSKGKVLFWKSADVPGKGEYFRVYLGKYEIRNEAVDFWERLNDEGSVSYFGIHRFEENEYPDIPESIENDLVQAIVLEGQEKGRFVDNGDGTVTDRKTNLMWIKNGWRLDFFSAVGWKDAIKKCETFKYGGYSDWRLPTIKEWKSLLDKKKEYPAIAEPNPFENIIVHMPYWSNTEFNSSQTPSTKSPLRAYTVMLYYGRVSHQNISKLAFIMPVRSLN
jgi:hypothetical protein